MEEIKDALPVDGPETPEAGTGEASSGEALLVLGKLLACGRDPDEPSPTPADSPDRELIQSCAVKLAAQLATSSPNLVKQLPGPLDAHGFIALRMMAVLAQMQFLENHPDINLHRIVRGALGAEHSYAEWLAAVRMAGELCRSNVFRARPGPFLSVEVEPGEAITELVVGKASPWGLTVVNDVPVWRLRPRTHPVSGKTAPASKKIPYRVPPEWHPDTIAKKLARTVVGLDEITRPFACRLSRHLARAELAARGRDPGTPNECLLFIGPSGSGKTFLAEAAGRGMNLPFSAIPATDITAEGYTGLSVEDALRPLMAGLGDTERPRRPGICLLDEWDKKAANSRPGERDVGGVAVQHGFLRIMEGCQTKVGGRRGNREMVNGTFDSRGTFFIFAGAFTALNDILERQRKRGGGLGFGPVGETAPAQGSPLYDALVEFGMIPEFLNRLTGIMVFPEPNREQLRAILTDPARGALPTLNTLMSAYGIVLDLTPKAADLLVGQALANKTYSRGLKLALEGIADRVLLEGQRGNVVVTAGMLAGCSIN